MARERVLPQYGLHQHGEPVDALAHIGVAQGQVCLQPSRKQRHGHGTRSSSLGTASEEALTSTICTVTNIGASQGMAGGAGSVRRVPAADIEALVVRSVREHLKAAPPIDDRSL